MGGGAVRSAVVVDPLVVRGGTEHCVQHLQAPSAAKHTPETDRRRTTGWGVLRNKAFGGSEWAVAQVASIGPPPFL